MLVAKERAVVMVERAAVAYLALMVAEEKPLRARGLLAEITAVAGAGAGRKVVLAARALVALLFLNMFRKEVI